MDAAELTKSADEILCKIYKEFKAKEKESELREKARCFSKGPEYPTDILRELKGVGFIRNVGWDSFALEPAAIAYMENRPGIWDKALEMGAKIKNATPFI